jgi:hypothetical protein
MTTEQIKVTREVEEVWEVREVQASWPSVNVVGIFQIHGSGDVTDRGRYRGNWHPDSIAPMIPSVRAAAERLWEQIRPLQSGTSPDGSPWGEVRVEGEAPVRCEYRKSRHMDDRMTLKVVKSGNLPTQESFNGFSEPDSINGSFTWSPLAAAWFAANPWPVKSERMSDDEVRKVEGNIVTLLGRALGSFKRDARTIGEIGTSIGLLLGELTKTQLDRDAWKERAEKAKKLAEQHMDSLLRQERANGELTRGNFRLRQGILNLAKETE